MADGAAVIGSSKQIKLELLRIALKSYDWVKNHIQLFEAGECDLPLDTLNSLGSKHLVAIESCMSVDDDEILNNEEQPSSRQQHECRTLQLSKNLEEVAVLEGLAQCSQLMLVR